MRKIMCILDLKVRRIGAFFSNPLLKRVFFDKLGNKNVLRKVSHD